MWPVIALMMAMIAFISGWMFLPVIQVSTNATNTGLTAALESSGFADTPLAPIIHGMPIWMMAFVALLVFIVFITVAKRGA